MIEYENLRLVNKPYEEAYREALDTFLESGWYILGQQVKQFEEDFAQYCGSKHCIGLASGLDALYLSLLALGLPKGSEVLVPSNTYIATILSIINAGLKPVLVEPKIDTYNIDPNLIAKAINGKTKAIMVVHLYGKPCEMEVISEIAATYKLPIIEDCAQAHGAHVKGKKVGTWGVLGAYSFYPTKNLGALGDAGAIITDSDEMANKLRALRNYGSHQKYRNDYLGSNSRLDELQAIFLSIKLKKLDADNAHKKNLANVYFEHLKNLGLILPALQDGITDVHHIFNVRTDERDRLKSYLLEKGIKTEIHYPVAPHHQAAYRPFFESLTFPISELIHQTTLSLPISNALTVEDIKSICKVVNDFK